GGEQQRLAVARALAKEAQNPLLDEPTASPAPAATKAIEDVIRKGAASGIKGGMSTPELGEAKRRARANGPRHRGPRVERRAGGGRFIPRAKEGGGGRIPRRRRAGLPVVSDRRAWEEKNTMPPRRSLVVLAATITLIAAAPAHAQDKSIVVASTTSTQDSGLF